MSEGGSSESFPTIKDTPGSKLTPPKTPTGSGSSSSASPSSAAGETSRIGSSGMGTGLGKRPNGLAPGRHMIETVVVDQSVVSAAEEQAALDRLLPVIGVLVGSAPPENACAIIKSLWRIQRDAASLLEDRRIAPADIMATVNRRIRDEGSMILGYYFCADSDGSFIGAKPSADDYLEPKKEEAYGYCVDHGALMTAVLQTDCPRPIVMQIRRILLTDGDIEASIRLDFFASFGAAQTAEMVPSTVQLKAIPHRLMDSAYPSATMLKSLVESDVVAMEEVASFTDYDGGKGRTDLEYDGTLSRILSDAEQRTSLLLLNVQTRLASETLHLKQLIQARFRQIELLWRHQKTLASSQPNEASTGEACDGTRFSNLATQLVSKELASASADTLRKLPVSSHLAFYDRPSISMKATRSSLPSGLHPSPGLLLGRKRKTTAKLAGTATKGPPRPILPAQLPGEQRSRTPSMESLTLLAHSVTSVVAGKTAEDSSAPFLTRSDQTS